MTRATSPTETREEQPLISSRFMGRVAAVVTVLALLSGAISLAGHYYGEDMLLSGHSDSTAQFAVTIGQDSLRLDANTIRFASQRRDGLAERADLYLLWPEMTGYSKQQRRRFDDIQLSDTLIFAQISQSTMSRDMSGRVEPIYSHLFDQEAEPTHDGLTRHRLRAETGYADEVMFTAPREGKTDYAVRCILPKPGTPPSGGDCQRDIHVGQDLTVLYRFSSALLPQWESLDAAVRAYVESRLIGRPATARPLS